MDSDFLLLPDLFYDKLFFQSVGHTRVVPLTGTLENQKIFFQNMGVDIETIKPGDGANFPPKGCKVQGITILTGFY